MQFERLPNPKPHEAKVIIVIEKDELEVVEAAFKEHIASLITKGNIGSVREFQQYMAAASENASLANEEDENSLQIRAKVHDYENSLVAVLDEFVENTPDAVREIIDITGVPPFLNDDILLRMRYARRAEELAAQIREAAGAQPAEIEDQEAVIEKFRKQLDGDEFIPTD